MRKTLPLALAMEALALLFLTTILATSHASHVGEALKPLPIHLLRPLAGSGDHHVHGILCTSWRLAVETNNIRNWTTVPLSCEKYVGHYMLGDLYRKDSKVVADAAAIYAASLKLKGDGKDIWVFDVDETVLSNLPYYAKHGFGYPFIRVSCMRGVERMECVCEKVSNPTGRFNYWLRAEPFNSTLFNEWVDLGKAPPLPESLKLYKKLLSLGIKVVFLTGRKEVRRKITEKNLKNAGFHTWEKVILRLPEEEGAAMVFKSNNRRILEDKGYRIVGNMGDQWSDILGTNVGQRTFKVPDPMYYIS